MNKKKEREVFYTFREELDRQHLVHLARTINTITAYVAIVGGVIKENNLLSILEYSGVNINREEDLDMVIRGFSFYIGAKLIKVVDQSQGLAEIINDPESDIIQFGEQRDITDVLKHIEYLRTKVAVEEGDD
jgi:hypothetical protein